jgi:hypothetical protein
MTLLLAWVRRIDLAPRADDPIVFGERAAKCSIGVRRVHLPGRLDDISVFVISRGGQRRVLIRGTLVNFAVSSLDLGGVLSSIYKKGTVWFGRSLGCGFECPRPLWRPIPDDGLGIAGIALLSLCCRKLSLGSRGLKVDSVGDLRIYRQRGDRDVIKF